MELFWRRALRAVLPVPIALYCRRQWLGRRVAAGKGYREGDVDLLPQLVRKTDVCWDIGANAGMYALPLARLGAKVFAFEPVPHNLDILRLATRLSRADNIVIKAIAISDTNGPARMVVPTAAGFYGGFYLAQFDDKGELPVTMATIDSLIEGGLPAPDFIKCDVEGAEGRVIAGARKLIAERHPIWLLETFREDVMTLMQSLGYSAHVRTDEGRLVPVSARTHARNYVFLPTRG
jgi:FkbM family methyltransferase